MDDSTSSKRLPESPGQAPSTATPNPQDGPIIRLNLNRSTESPPSASTQIPSTPRAKQEPNVSGVSSGNSIATGTARQYQHDERTDAAPGASGTTGDAVRGNLKAFEKGLVLLHLSNKLLLGNWKLLSHQHSPSSLRSI